MRKKELEMRFSACLDTVLQDMTPAQRIKEFARSGYKGFELWCWWDYDVDELITTAKGCGSWAMSR